MTSKPSNPSPSECPTCGLSEKDRNRLSKQLLTEKQILKAREEWKGTLKELRKPKPEPEPTIEDLENKVKKKDRELSELHSKLNNEQRLCSEQRALIKALQNRIGEMVIETEKRVIQAYDNGWREAQRDPYDDW